MSSIFHYLGGFHITWSAYETNLEMICMRELGLTPKQNHIVFGSLGFATKMEITISLLKNSARPDTEDSFKAIRLVPQIARRNHITHSLGATNDNFSLFEFVKRDIANGLSAKTLKFDLASMRKHFLELNEAADALEQPSGFIHAGLLLQSAW